MCSRWHTVRQTLWMVRKDLTPIFLVAAAFLMVSGCHGCKDKGVFIPGPPLETFEPNIQFAMPTHVAIPSSAGAQPAADIHQLRLHAVAPTSIGGIERKIDGSYTLHRYQTSDPYAQIDVTPNFIASSVAYTGYPRRPLQVPAGWRPGSDNQLGVSSYPGVGADLTGSGTLDAVAASQDLQPGVSVVAVGLSNADYTLRNHTEYPVGLNPWTVLAADFNGDGKRDLVVFTGGSYYTDGTLTVKGNVSVLINNGDGTFKAAVNYAAGGSPAQGTVQDFNGDGKLDIAAIDESAGLVTILLGNGDGTFRTGATLSVPQAYYVAAADLNGDSKQDLVVVTNANKLAVLLGNGDGTFKSPSMTALSGNSNTLVSNPAIGDFNKDGKPDVVVVGYNSQTAQVLFGAGDGTFSTSVRYLLGSLATTVLVSDVDWDGNLDIVIGAGHPDALTPSIGEPDELSILFGNGDGTFYGPQAHPVAAGTSSSAMASADFNGDGRPDIALTSPDGSTQVLLQSGGGFQTTTVAGSGYGIVAKDFNGDGKPDLVVGAGSSNSVWFAGGNGNGTFQPPVSIATGNPSYLVDAGDLNGDGKLDLVTASGIGIGQGSSSPNVVTVLMGNGNGTFQSPKTVSGFSNPVDAKLADLNGDGKLDMVVVNGAIFDTSGNIQPGAGISILLGKGDGTFQPPVLLYAGGQPTKAFIADINGDGKPDILVLTEDPTTFAYQVAVFLNTGNGTFAPATFTATDFGPSSLAVADFNNDGDADLLITHCCGNVTVTTYMLGNGDGTFQPEVFLVGPPAGTSVIAADFNGDGKVDAAIVTAPDLSEDYLVVLTNVTAAAPPAQPAAVSTNPGSGSGATKTFTFTFSDGGGYQNLSVVDVLINNALDGRRACYVAFAPASASSGSLFLVDDAGDAGGPYQGLVLPGGGTVGNGQCTISGAGSSVVGSGNTLTLTLAIAFSAGFAGNQVVYTSAGDKSPANSGWQALGTWGVPGAAPSGPWVGGMSPARGNSLGPTNYTFTFNDTNGWQDIAVANILINSAIDGRHGCYMAYVTSTNSLLLVDDAGDAGGPYSVLLSTASNSQCSISAAGSSVSGSGNTLTLVLPITFSQSFTGNQLFFLAARSNTANSNWQAMGSVTVP